MTRILKRLISKCSNKKLSALKKKKPWSVLDHPQGFLRHWTTPPLGILKARYPKNRQGKTNYFVKWRVNKCLVLNVLIKRKTI